MKKDTKILLLNLAAAVAAVIAVFIVINVLLALVTRHGREITVPDFSGMTPAEAAVAAQKAGIRTVLQDSVYVKDVRRGTVYLQNPKASDKVKKGRRVFLTINATAVKMSTMPSLAGLSTRQARAELLSAGLTLGRVYYVEDIATDNVLAQKYKGTAIEPGTTLESSSAIDLLAGLAPGDEMTCVPDLTGLTFRNALSSIYDNSLNRGKLFFDSTVKNGADSVAAVVYSQSPRPNSVRRGSSVSLYLTLDTSKLPQEELPQ